MAPELIRGESTNTAASDVYAFGIILYECYSRKDPYEGEDAREVLAMVADPEVNKRPPIPKDTPPQIASLMEDCLVANPSERPTFEEVDTRLKRVEIKPAADRTTISLFDIFPKHIAEALRDGKKVEAEHKECVTIFFSDIVGYTDISSTLEPQKVANLLDRLYHRFDDLAGKHDIFKVETIGDAYMAVTNLVKDQEEDHAARIAEFAVDAIRAANSTLIDEDDPERGYLNIRVGFHSGPVVADIVGNRNPRYCLFGKSWHHSLIFLAGLYHCWLLVLSSSWILWTFAPGDTVNVASRMESNSKANRILISDAAADVLRVQKCKYSAEKRHIKKIKGKGEVYCHWIKFDREVLNGDRVPEPESALEPSTELSTLFEGPSTDFSTPFEE